MQIKNNYNFQSSLVKVYWLLLRIFLFHNLLFFLLMQLNINIFSAVQNYVKIYSKGIQKLERHSSLCYNLVVKGRGDLDEDLYYR